MEKNPSMDFTDEAFRCPISKELMNEPVTICTGVTYELKNIQKWIFTYKKTTCPATMQVISSFDMTPNHTLKRLIESWRIAKISQSHSSNLEISNQQADLKSLLNTIKSTPFKVSYLKKLRLLIENGDESIKNDLKKSGRVQVIVEIIIHILSESYDFAVFRACEEALGILHQLLPLCEQEYESEHDIDIELLVKPNCIKSYALILQRGSSEARFFAVSLFYKLIKIDINHVNWINDVTQDEGIDFFKSLLEIISDDDGEGCTKSSRCALLVLIEILDSSKKSRLKAIEAGAVCTLTELIVCETNKSRCEKIMQVIKLICECAEGRLAFIEHGLGIAGITKKILNVSNVGTKIGVKILWLICKSHPTEIVLEEMLMNGAVKKLVEILNINGGEEEGGRASLSSTSTKCRAIKIFKLHAKFWKRHPCFPRELHKFLGLGD